ncbi:MAG TPA: hypothetical protein ENI15_13045 [Spirochaetes bacterium]|nr:hypothetical protein [Spirochaetota bacterium]
MVILLSSYKKNPKAEEKIRLFNLFDDIFPTKTGYDDLDYRIQLTKKKKDSLLVVLDYPDPPLHNNPAELAIRMYVIKRKINFGTSLMMEQKVGKPSLPSWIPALSLVSISGIIFTIEYLIKTKCCPSHLLF